MEAGVATDTAQPARFSRYRSVRKAAVRVEEPPSVPKVPQLRENNDQQSQGQVNHAPSRYRRPITTRYHDAPLPKNDNAALPVRNTVLPKVGRPEPIPEAPDVSQPTPALAADPGQQGSSNVTPLPHTSEQQYRLPVQAQDARPRTSRYRSRTSTAPKEKATSPRRSYDQAREEARMILEGEYDRLQRLKKQQEQAEHERRKRAQAKLAAAQKAAQAEEQARIQADQRKQAEEEPEPQQSRKWTIGGGSSHKSPPVSAPQSPPTSQRLQPVRSPASRSPSHDGRRQRVEESSGEAAATENVPSGEVERPKLRERIRRPTVSRQKETPAPRPFEPKAGDGPPKTAVNGPTPTADAPVSAVNAGERRVEVRFNSSKITLPVTPSTTAKDLLNSASLIMSQPIDLRNSVLIETYYPLRLERPLRRYEHIRDVMNSWDSDTQNYLMIMSQSECAAVGLEHKHAPTEQPSRTMLQLYHSQRPGKWEKHWMILRSDGQVTASTKENDVDATNVFHLSDFDVYTPTPKQLKKLRPPKKLCFAIKSQQRSIMFESTENFVHFFSTNDKATADRWYHSVQAWRSWYLVNVLGEGTAPAPAPAPAPTTTITPSGPASSDLPGNSRPPTSHKRDSIPYQLGTFQPLLEFSADAFKYGDDANPPAQPQEAKLPSSPQRNKTLIAHARNKSVADPKATGLDRHMTTKRATPPTSFPHHAREASTSKPMPPSSTDAAFTGKGLLARTYSIKKAQAEENAAFLQDPANAFTGGGLLSRARSVKRAPENPVPILVENTADAFTGSGFLSSARSVRRAAENPNPGVIENTDDAFTGAGLLSVQRTLTKKRSGASTRPGQPLVDLSGNSSFVDGSLLRQVEGHEIAMGMTGPVIDRNRGVEVREKVGEV